VLVLGILQKMSSYFYNLYKPGVAVYTVQKLLPVHVHLQQAIVMLYFSASRVWHIQVCNVFKVMTVFALLLTNMPYTQAQTCNSDMTTYTIPAAGSKARIYYRIWCPSFTAPVDGFLDHLTVVITGSMNNYGYGLMYNGVQYRNGVHIASASQGEIEWMDMSYKTRTRAIELDFLQGDVFSASLITTNVSFMYDCNAHIPEHNVLRTIANSERYGKK